MIVRDLIDGMRKPQAVSTSTPSAMLSGRGLHGAIPLIGSRGMARQATYRLIYLTNPWVYAAVNKLARDLARMSLHTYELTNADGDRERVRGDVPLTPARLSAAVSLDRLLAQPDPRLSRFACWNGTLIDKLTYGNALWEIERLGGGGAPTSFRRWSWRDVIGVEEGFDSIQYYELQRGGRLSSVTGEPIRRTPGDVVHFGRGMDAESAVAVSPLESCRYTLALYEGVVRHLVAFFQNQAKPSGQINVENLTLEKAALIRELVQEAYTSPENAGKVLITSGKWEETTTSPNDAEVVELIKLSREEVVAVYGMPPPMLGILDRAIKSNVKELREQYIREGQGPLAKEMEDEVRAQIIPLSPAWRYMFAEFQLNEALRPDLEARAEVYDRMKRIFSIDDIRKFENEKPFEIKGVTDVPWAGSGEVPVTRAAEADFTTTPGPVVDPDDVDTGPDDDDDEEDDEE